MRLSPSSYWLPLTLVLAGACASSGSHAPETAPRAEVGGAGESDEAVAADPAAETMGASDEEATQLMDELGATVTELDSALRLANCSDAFEHRDAICTLSVRICDIADSHSRAIERCEDAELRCADARERVSDECD